jgi:methyl-accepting chemotaxis protein
MAEQRVKQQTFNPSAPPSDARGLSLRAKMTIAMLVLALAPLGVVAALVFNRVDQVVLRQVAVDSEAAARERARQIGEEVERVNQSSYLLAAAQLTRLRGAEMGQREDFLLSAQSNSGAINRIMLIDPASSTILVSAPRVNSGTRADLPETAKNGQFTTGLGWSDTKQAQYRVFTPVMAQGRVQFVLELDADFRSLVGPSALPRADDGAFLTIVDKDGKALFGSQQGWEEIYKEAVKGPQLEAALRGQATSGWSKGGPLGDVYLAASPIAGPNWVALYAIPSAKALNAAAELRSTLVRDLLMVVGLLALVALAASVALSRQFVSPILHLAGVMERVRAGRLDARATVRSNDELGALSRDVNQTLDSLVSLVQTREERDELQSSIRHLLDEVSEVAAGDLTVEAEVSAGPTGAIADSFNYMIEELRGLVQRTQSTADQVSTEAGQVTTLTERLVTSATDQRRRLDEARAAVTEMTGLMAEVRTTVGDSVAATGEAREAVEAGQQAVGETMSAIGRLRGEARETAMKIKRLGESSQEIGEIVRLINEIADQTHLLALNASIQAAMAGEHGRGFAVVAEEVRALAERSAAATSKIEELIRVIQADTNAAMVAMERSTQEVVAGSRLADKAGNALTAIGDVTERIVALSGQIEDLVSRQVTTAEALEATVAEVAGATNQATDDVREVADGMQELVHLSASLRESVSVFRVEADEIPAEEPAGESAVAEEVAPVEAIAEGEVATSDADEAAATGATDGSGDEPQTTPVAA